MRNHRIGKKIVMLSLIVTLIMGLWPSVSYINAAETETEASQESTDASVSGDNMTGNDVAETEMLSESTEVSATDDTSTSVNTAEMGTTYDESLVSSKSDDSLTNKTNWESLADFSEGETYYIATASDLVKMAELVNLGRTGTGCSFLLTNDIDLSSVYAADTSGWVSIGNSAENCFGGIFDGNNFAIHNIYISSTETNYGGLFGYLSGATIKNLTLNGIFRCLGTHCQGKYIRKMYEQCKYYSHRKCSWFCFCWRYSQFHKLRK